MKCSGVNNTFPVDNFIAPRMTVAVEDEIDIQRADGCFKALLVPVEDREPFPPEFYPRGNLGGDGEPYAVQIRQQRRRSAVGVTPHESAGPAHKLIKDLFTAHISAMDNVFDFKPIKQRQSPLRNPSLTVGVGHYSNQHRFALSDAARTLNQVPSALWGGVHPQYSLDRSQTKSPRGKSRSRTKSSALQLITPPER